jgi:spore coat polysaccharide biosynthesis protein SpsF
MNIVCIVQARMGSTRLPGKIMKDVAGESMLERCLNRLKRCVTLDRIVIATTELARDDVVVDWCGRRHADCFRGNEDDVLDRYYRAAKEYAADVVVRVTSDCPLIDPALTDDVVKFFVDAQPDADYVSNSLPQPTYPIGLNVEVMTFQALERAWRDDGNPAWREHVTPYIYLNPSLFRCAGYAHSEDYSYMRWTVDTPEDLILVNKIYGHFGHDRFTWTDVLKVLQEKSDWIEINRHIKQKSL